MSQAANILEDMIYDKIEDLIVRKAMFKLFGGLVGGWKLKLIEFAVSKLMKHLVVPALKFLKNRGIVLVHKMKLKDQLGELNNAKTSAEFDAAFDNLM